MSIKKQYFKTKPYCKVTFRLPRTQAGKARNVCVVGDFNQWRHDLNPMQSLKSGDFKTTVTLVPGREYQFRYVLDDRHWTNDGQADKYVFSPYGNCENSVIVV